MTTPGNNETRKDSRTGFTVALCQACGDPELPVLQHLRETIRRCPHGVLVSSSCLLGRLSCHTRTISGSPGGAIVVVQPCSSTSREPLGHAIRVGPLRTHADLAALARWLRQSRLTPGSLPPRLQPRRNETSRN